MRKRRCKHCGEECANRYCTGECARLDNPIEDDQDGDGE